MSDLTVQYVAARGADAHIDSNITVPELIFSFPIGIPGYPELRGFHLLPLGGEYGPFLALRNVSSDYPVFVVVQPSAVVSDYTVEIDDVHEQLLGVDKENPNLLVFLIATLNNADNLPFVNLAAPLVINLDNLTGFQIPQGDPTLSMNHKLSTAFRDSSRV